jgi:chemotaxis protein MotD
MMPNVAMGNAVSGTHAKSGERGGKNADAADQRFAEALDKGADKRKPADAREGEKSAGATWRTAPYASPMAMPSRAEVDALDDGTTDALPADAEGLPAAVPTPDDEPSSEVGSDASKKVTGDDPIALIDALTAPPSKPWPASVPGPATAAKEAPEAAAKQATPSEIIENRPSNPVAATSTPSNPSVFVAAAATTAAPARPAGEQPSVRRADPKSPAQPQFSAARNAPQPEAEATPRPSSTQADLMQLVRPGEAVSARSDARSRSFQAMPDALSSRVNVVSFNTTPASAPPVAMPLLGATAAGLVSAIEGDGAWRAMAREVAATPQQNGAPPHAASNSLRIQLNPAELGMVTARLVTSGTQLTVELQVESTEARQKLTTDSDSIVKALRAIGYDIEKVTIQQGPQNNLSNQQQGQGMAAGRDQLHSDQQQGDRNARGRGNDAAGNGNEGTGHGMGETAAERSGGGIYI